jgi:large subunit ribosomal protein L19
MAKASSKTKAKKAVKKPSQTPGVETNLIRRVTIKPISKTIQDFKSGDTVNVFVKVKEGEKERVQLYKGIVTKIQGSGAAKSFTVRKISAGVGVERTFPFRSPVVDRVEVVSIGKVRRSKLYYLRGLDGKAAKIESELVTQESATTTPAVAE